MTDRIQLTNQYTYMILDGQPQIVLSGSIIDVNTAGAFPTATVVTSNVSTAMPGNGKGNSVSGVKVK